MRMTIRREEKQPYAHAPLGTLSEAREALISPLLRCRILLFVESVTFTHGVFVRAISGCACCMNRQHNPGGEISPFVSVGVTRFMRYHWMLIDPVERRHLTSGNRRRTLSLLLCGGIFFSVGVA